MVTNPERLVSFHLNEKILFAFITALIFIHPGCAMNKGDIKNIMRTINRLST